MKPLSVILEKLKEKYPKYSFPNIENEYGKQDCYPSLSKITTICDKGHTNDNTTLSALLGKGTTCPICSKTGKQDVKVIKDTIIKTNPTFIFPKIDEELEIYSNKGGSHQSKITVNCSIHNEEIFTSTISLLKNGKRRCPVCKDMVGMTTDKVKDKIIEVHGDIFDFSEMIYKNKRTKLRIICKKHKEVIGIDNKGILYSDIISGDVCYKCSIENRSWKKDDFLKAIKDKKINEDDNYDYSLMDNFSRKGKKKIRCKKHNNIFSQSMGNHLSGRKGCKFCGRVRDLESFIVRANELHNNKFDYSLIKEYTKIRDYVDIICEFDHIFSQTFDSHLQGSGCTQCASEYLYVGMNEKDYLQPYLEKIIDYKLEFQYPIKNETGNYYIDVYIPELNLVIEYDEFHHYDSRNKEKDIIRQKYIENKLGCDFVRIDDKKFMKDNYYANKILAPVIGDYLIKENIEDLFE
jgi:very-short-patch-repair endonuclease/nitrite reductase/ring-hydroxylating ferredoxin subunit